MKPRILLIEDDPHRIEIFRKLVAGSEFVLIEAKSGGRAMGILRKGMTDGIVGVCLDNDLEKQCLTESDQSLSGTKLISAISLSIPRSAPILIHSMNASQPPAMERRLTSYGFSVTRIHMVALTQTSFNEWLQEVRDNLEE